MAKTAKTEPKPKTASKAKTASKPKTEVKPKIEETIPSFLDWKQIYFAGTEWSTYKDIDRVRWDFDHLEEALATNDELRTRSVYLFGSTERMSSPGLRM